MLKKLFFLIVTITVVLASILPARAAYRLNDFRARPPIHIYGAPADSPQGFTPEQIKSAYHLPSTGGDKTIAIITAYHTPSLERDLAVFSHQFNLSACTVKNDCFERHMTHKNNHQDKNWSMETSLDVEWAHAIAPDAKILLVEAPTPSGVNLLEALDYARARPDVIAVSMSWGGAEFQEEVSLEDHFVGLAGTSFFAASGDTGTGVNWPAVSPRVIAVGGTSLSLKKKYKSDPPIFTNFSQPSFNQAENFSRASNKEVTNKVVTEIAWGGSGGGVSKYEFQPTYQKKYNVPHAEQHRAVPDVAYNADPLHGFSIYYGGRGQTKGWYTVGGTSAGAPQWAAIHALGHSVTHEKLYRRKDSKTNKKRFRDIVKGSNGECGYYCSASPRYDYVTGLGSPLTINF